MLKRICFILCLYTISGSFSFAADHTIAITIDDLPFVGDGRKFHLNKMIDTLQEHAIPVTGFIIAKEVRKADLKTLQRFKKAGFNLGSHTLTHADANHMRVDQYLEEIDQADAILSELMTTPKYFRFPYLAEGRGENRSIIAEHLAEKGYQVAPVTIDSKDYKYNQLLLSVPEWERRKFLADLIPIYLNYIWKQTKKAEKRSAKNAPQILLIHANLLTAYSLPALIQFYRAKGYRFISLQEALQPSDKQSKIRQEGPKIGSLLPSFSAEDVLAITDMAKKSLADKDIEDFKVWD